MHQSARAFSCMGKNLMKITVVTTFHQEGLNKYGQRMIDTFLKNWPPEVKLFLYPENCSPVVNSSDRVTIIPLEQVSELMKFKDKWKNVPKANGDVSADPVRSKRKDAGKGFKWHAVRFAHKVYAIFDCARITDADMLIWMDADTICHSPITMKDLHRMIPSNSELCYLGRKGKYSECGLYSMNLKSQNIQNFLKEFQRMYDDAESGIFLLDEWHDSFVFDAVRKKFPQIYQIDWAAHLHDLRPAPGMSSGEGHPLINSEWGAWLDHLKGGRKKLGRSKREDLKVHRTEAYWQ
jgi:hypothetical protein